MVHDCAMTAVLEGISWHYSYHAGDVISPLTYSCHSLSSTTNTSYFISLGRKIETHLPNNLQLVIDSEFSWSLSDSKSYYCIIFLLLNVAIQCKVKKSQTIAGYTTYAEMKDTYSGISCLLPLCCTLNLWVSHVSNQPHCMLIM